MDKTKENIVNFIDSIIEEKYSEAHKFLEVVINEKVKKQISEAAKQHPFKKNGKSNKSAIVKGAQKGAFGGKFPQAKNPNKKQKIKESIDSETLNLRSIFDSNLFSKMGEIFRKYCHREDSRNKYMEVAYTLGKIDMDSWGGLLDEIDDCIKLTKDNSDKAYLKAIRTKIADAGAEILESEEEMEDRGSVNVETPRRHYHDLGI